jgi:hypothetical protein
MSKIFTFYSSIFLFLLVKSINVNAQVVFEVSEDGKEHSYQEIHEAVTAASKLITKQGYPEEGIEILIKDGYYKLDKKVLLTENLSGTIEKPLVIRAENIGGAHLVGGNILNFKDFKKFKPSDAGFDLVDSKAASHIRVFNLKKAGIKKSQLGAFFKHGYGFENNPYFTTPTMLWVDGERMPLARWPNEGETNPYYDNVNQFKGRFSDVAITGAVSMIDVVDKGATKKFKWYENQSFLNHGGGTFTVGFDKSKAWSYYKKSDEKIWLDGVLAASWEWEYTEVKELKKKEITLASGTNRGLGVFKKVTHFHFENVPEELDTPGEYFIDRDRMLLYFYPVEAIANKVIVLATMSSDMIVVEGASNLMIQGLVLESGRESAIRVKNKNQGARVIARSHDVTIKNCTIRNFNQWGVLVEKAHNTLVDRCHIYNLGAGGVKLGIEAKQFSLEKENNTVSNCEIHHIAFDQKSQVPGITLAGCGNIARNNEIYNTPHFAIKMKFTNDCVAENNYLHDLPEYHHFDGGALYLATGSNFYNRGNVIRENYFENISTNGAYLDNYTMGNTVEKNVFFNVGNSTKGSKNGAVYIHGGGQNKVQNNVAIDCPYAYKTGSHIVKAPNTTNYLNAWYTDAVASFESMNPLYVSYCARYPELVSFLDKLHNSPELIHNHVRNKSLKQISNPKNRKKQLDMYDLHGATDFYKDKENESDWSKWFQLRYQSTLFKNNITCFTTKQYLPDLVKTKGAYVLAGSSGVFAMSPYKLKLKTGFANITNHVFEGNKVLDSVPTSIGAPTNGGRFVLNNQISVSEMQDFISINFLNIGIIKE